MFILTRVEFITFLRIFNAGSKRNYAPALPPLTGCRQDPKFVKHCRRATPCKVGVEDSQECGTSEADHPHPSTSSRTQHLYIHLNTLHGLLEPFTTLSRPSLRIHIALRMESTRIDWGSKCKAWRRKRKSISCWESFSIWPNVCTYINSFLWINHFSVV